MYPKDDNLKLITRQLCADLLAITAVRLVCVCVKAFGFTVTIV